MTNEKLHRQNRVVLIILILLICCGLGIYQYFNYALSPVDPSANQMLILIF